MIQVQNDRVEFQKTEDDSIDTWDENIIRQIFDNILVYRS